MQWCREIHMGAQRYPGIVGTRHFAPGTWDHINYPLDYVVTSPWSVEAANTTADKHHKRDLLQRLCEEVSGYFYYCVEVGPNPTSSKRKTAEGLLVDTSYCWRYHMRFANKDDAMLFKLSTVF